MSFVLRKLNQVQQASPQSLEGYKNKPTRELKIYQQAPRVNPAETRSTAWVWLQLGILFFKQDAHSGSLREEEEELITGKVYRRQGGKMYLKEEQKNTCTPYNPCKKRKKGSKGRKIHVLPLALVSWFPSGSEASLPLNQRDFLLSGTTMKATILPGEPGGQFKKEQSRCSRVKYSKGK